MNINLFKAVGDLALGAKRRQEAEYADFLAFYRQLVETLPIEVTNLFGNLAGIPVARRGEEPENVGLELNVADLLWWEYEFQSGTRFVHGIARVKSDMLRQLVLKAETNRLSPEERQKLLALLDASPAS